MPGLYDDEFAGFRLPSSEEVDSALREAIVAIDANVLLTLYRFREETARDLLRVLQRLDDRLIVPHQAIREFWRHRQRAPGSPNAATTTALDAVAKATRSMTMALDAWSKQVGYDNEARTSLAARVAAFGRNVQEEVSSVQKDVSAIAVEGDPILEQLEGLLNNRVTSALSAEEWEQCVTEGRRRVSAGEPPGYKDADKEGTAAPEGPAGDYLVWYEATTYARERDSDLIIVTADEKEDWWWRQRNVLVGPRPELALEYQRLTGRRLFLLRPPELLARADALHVDVEETSVADAAQNSDGDGPIRQWTETAFFERLAQRSAAESEIARRLLEWAEPRFSGIRWGYGKVDGSFYPRLFAGRASSLFVVYTNGLLEIRFGSVSDLSPFDDAVERERLRNELNQIPGWTIPPVADKSYPTVPLAALRDDSCLGEFTRIIEAAAAKIWAATPKS